MALDCGAEPIARLAARSVAALCASAPVYREALRLGAEPLIRVVEQQPLLADRLLQISRIAPPPPTADVDAPFERYMIFLLEDIGDLGFDEVIAFGAGLNGRLFARLARVAQVRVRCFVDNDATRRPRAIEGAPVVSLVEARTIPHLPFVVCTMAGCTDVMQQLAPIQESEARLVFTHLNSWRSRLEHDVALETAADAFRRTLREAIEEKAAWASAYLLCNYRRLVHDWATGATEKRPAPASSPFVYQMQ